MQSRTELRCSEGGRACRVAKYFTKVGQIMIETFHGRDFVILVMQHLTTMVVLIVTGSLLLRLMTVVHLLQIVATLHLAGMDLWKYFINEPIIRLFSLKMKRNSQHFMDFPKYLTYHILLEKTNRFSHRSHGDSNMYLFWEMNAICDIKKSNAVFQFCPKYVFTDI